MYLLDFTIGSKDSLKLLLIDLPADHTNKELVRVLLYRIPDLHGLLASLEIDLAVETLPSAIRALLVTVGHQGTALVHVGHLVTNHGEVGNRTVVRKDVVQTLLIHGFWDLSEIEETR